MPWIVANVSSVTSLHRVQRMRPSDIVYETLLENFLDFLRGTIPKEILDVLEEEPCWFGHVAEMEGLLPEMVEELSEILHGEHFANIDLDELAKHLFRAGYCSQCDIVFDSFFRGVDDLPPRRRVRQTIRTQ